MKSLRIGVLLAIAICVIAASAYAHHSAAGIDQQKTVSLEGVVKEFKWANPHSWIELDVKNAKGVNEVWNLEMNPPSYLVKAGWKSSTIKPGDKIKFSAHPFKNGDPGGLFVSVTLADGRTLGQNAPRGGGAPAPAYEQK